MSNPSLSPFPQNLASYSSSQLRAWLDGHTVRLLRGVEPPRATLRQLDCGLIAKDFLDSEPWYRYTLGRWLLGREERIYRRLEGIEGIPGRVARPHSDLLVMEYLAGACDLKKVPLDQLPWSALEQLRALLEAIHSRGVVHFDIGHDSNGDYGRETNLLWREGRLYLIDFAGSLSGVPQPLFKLLVQADNLAILKVLRRFFPQKEEDPPPGWDFKAYEPRPWERRLLKKLGKL